MILYISSYNLKNTLTSLNSLYKKSLAIKEEKGFENNKRLVINNIGKAIQEAEDIELFCEGNFRYTGDNSLSYELKILKDKIQKEANTYDELATELSNVMNEIYKMGLNTISSSDINERIEDIAYYNCENIQIDKINMIQKSIAYTDRKINYFNPCCHHLYDEQLIKDSFDNVDIYNIIEEKNTFTDIYKNYVDNNVLRKTIIIGNSYLNNPSEKIKVRITNVGFDILNIQPEVSDSVRFKNNTFTYPSDEFYALKENIKYLRKDGVLFYTIPYTRFTNEIKLFLAKNFKDISVVKIKDSEIKNIIIIGQKNYFKNYEETYKMLKELDYSTISENIEAGKYILPEKAKTIEIFRGGKITEKELENIITGDNLYNEFYKQIDNKNVVIDPQPLLPFNLGQIGLVLTSGKLDGIVEEPNNKKHVIKGRTIKYTESTEQLVNNVEQRVDKISNKVQINAFDASGKFIQIN